MSCICFCIFCLLHKYTKKKLFSNAGEYPAPNTNRGVSAGMNQPSFGIRNGNMKFPATSPTPSPLQQAQAEGGAQSRSASSLRPTTGTRNGASVTGFYSNRMQTC